MAKYISRRRYITVSDRTTVNVRTSPDGSVLYRLYHGTPVKLVPSKEKSGCYFILAWEPAARNGYVKKEFVTSTDSEPNNPRSWANQIFGTQNLSKGSSGPNVLNLQAYLNYFNSAGLKCDGIFGDLTKAAVKNFQTKKNLTSTGVANNATKAALAIERLPNDFFDYEN